MWIYRNCSDDTTPCQLINVSDLAVITTLDCASVTYGVDEYFVVGYSDYKEVQHSSDYVTLAVTPGREEAEQMVRNIYEALKSGAPVYDVAS